MATYVIASRPPYSDWQQRRQLVPMVELSSGVQGAKTICRPDYLISQAYLAQNNQPYLISN